jgi:hypothetical protein
MNRIQWLLVTLAVVGSLLSGPRVEAQAPDWHVYVRAARASPWTGKLTLMRMSGAHLVVYWRVGRVFVPTPIRFPEPDGTVLVDVIRREVLAHSGSHTRFVLHGRGERFTSLVAAVHVDGVWVYQPSTPILICPPEAFSFPSGLELLHTEVREMLETAGVLVPWCAGMTDVVRWTERYYLRNHRSPWVLF